MPNRDFWYHTYSTERTIMSGLLTKLNRYDTGSLVAHKKLSILAAWEKLALSKVSAACAQTQLDLQNSLPVFLDELVRTLQHPNSDQQAYKNSEVAKEHREHRATQRQYTLEEVIYEYDLLRLTLTRALNNETALDKESLEILHQFIDQGIGKAAVEYVEQRGLEEAALRIEKEQSRAELEKKVIELRNERELREQFVNTLTHDLRTPLTAAKLTAQMIQRNPTDTPLILRMIGRMIGSIDRTERMVRNLLDANHLKAGKGIPIMVDDCRIDIIVEETVKELVIMSGREVIIRNEAGNLAGRWDGEALSRVIANLVDNALKYGHPGSPITVGLVKKLQSVEISVHNKGAAIPIHDQRDLFHPSHRTASAIQSGQMGWGIGLSFVKSIIEAHGGFVKVLSSLENGTAFILHLPLEGKIAI